MIVEGLVGRESCDVGQPDEHFDAGGGGDGEDESVEMVVAHRLAEWCQCVCDPGASAAASQKRLVSSGRSVEESFSIARSGISFSVT